MKRSRRTFLALALLALGACGDDSTGRARVSFPVTARGVDTRFTTSRGWDVQVTQALVALGPLRWYEGPPVFALRWWERALGVSVAHAHPGHYVPGASLADVLTRRLVDLTATTATSLGSADGVTGAAQSAHIDLRPPAADLGPAASALDGATLLVRGVATMGARTVRFRGSLALSINLEGVTATGPVDASGWVVEVSVGRWIDRVDFSELAPATPDAEVVFGADSQAANALYRGATSVASYRLVKTSATDGGR